MEKWGGKLDDAAIQNASGIARQQNLVNTTSEYEFNVTPIPSNSTQIEQNVPPNTKVDFDIEFNTPEFVLMARKYKDGGDGQVAASSDKVSFEVVVSQCFIRVLPSSYRKHCEVYGRKSGSHQCGQPPDLSFSLHAL